jgi:hypothetical protein
MRPPRWRRAWPLGLGLLVVAYLAYVVMGTTFVQGLYIATLRDMYFGCMRPVDTAYLYSMVPGPCGLRNLEYDVSMAHDGDGFRNRSVIAAPRIAVLGDSHAYGHGVNDEQTLAALLGAQLGEPVRNLALPASATRREIEALLAHAPGAEIVVLQYCDNDFDENPPSLTLPTAAYRQKLRERMGAVMANYAHTKQQGAWGQAYLSLAYAAQQWVGARFYRFTSAAPDEKTLGREADAFAGVLEQYRAALAGKTVVVLESSGWGRNRKGFQAAFAQRLRSIGQVRWIVLDSTALLERRDYFRLDDHLNASGHAKLAAHLSPLLRPRP